MWKHKLQLGDWVDTEISGQIIKSITWTTVYCNKKSIRQSEHYAAANVGLKPEIMFEVHTHEYKGHEMVKFGEIEYAITRTYEKADVTELICQARVGELNG